MPTLAWFRPLPALLEEARTNYAARALTDRCTIEEWRKVRDARGTSTPRKIGERATAVPCRVDPVQLAIAGMENGGIYGRSGELIDTVADQWDIALPLGTTITAFDRIITSDGTVYQVDAVRDVGTEALAVVARCVRLGLDQPNAGRD